MQLRANGPENFKLRLQSVPAAPPATLSVSRWPNSDEDSPL